MTDQVIGERDFTAADQQWFAAISGDFNPIHMDAVAARRTLTKFPVVHGIHLLLWGLDSLLRYKPEFGPVLTLRARFEAPIYVGEHVEAVLARHDDERARMDLMVDGVRATQIALTAGAAEPGDPALAEQVYEPTQPLVLSLEEMREYRGAIRLPAEPDAIARAFPAAASSLGAARLAALAASSFLVGMVCPGLHSVYRGLNVRVTSPVDHPDPGPLTFRAVHTDQRFRVVRLGLSGGGWAGSIEAQARPEPVDQPSLAGLASRVVPGEFAGTVALVVGGSRGLGEVIAKLLAAGGARIALTYTLGESDARRVQGEITAHGGGCDILRYDVRAPAQPQLGALNITPNQVYYMATPPISQRRPANFVPDLFEEFFSFYVRGFYEMCRELSKTNNGHVSIFYPSSVYVDNRPENMTEYAMAKAAGEVLCADLQRFAKMGRILMRRLPQLPTDQTAAIINAVATDPVDAMLEIARDLHSLKHEDIPGRISYRR